MLPSILPNAYDSDRISAPIEIPDESPSPEAIRRAHIKAEANIKAIGQLLLLGVAVGAIQLVRSLGGAAGTGSIGAPDLALSLASLVATALSGAWLCASDSKGRLLFTLLSIVQLLMTPFELRAASEVDAGTGVSLTTMSAMTILWLLVRLVMLYMLWNGKGRMVMSRHYREAIIPATPGVEYRSRLPLLIALGVVPVIIIAVLVLAWG